MQCLHLQYTDCTVVHFIVALVAECEKARPRPDILCHVFYIHCKGYLYLVAY